MASFKSEDLAFHQPLKTMRQSIANLVTGAGLAALVVGSAQAAGAITITYSTTKATFVPVGAGNTRPLQMSATGSGITATRNFIYQGLVGDYAPAGAWMPVSQLGPGSPGPLGTGEQRFDYTYGPATSINPGPPQDNQWNNNLGLAFGSFYLDGTCDFCGAANLVSLVSASPTGQAQYIGEAPLQQGTGNQNKLTSSLYNIVFGASGKTGTLQYEAYTDITNGEPPFLRSENSGGRIILNINDPLPPTLPAPAPLPIVGVGAAFGLSRRLRQRIQAKAN